ncbi:hypothetical protein [Sphingomonas sp. GB1N7]|uniref:hypothetical protein n=1 Tax=Parasphingomonas caseinilytica TaxID=3096158 RepID=UPI002FC8A10A
MALAADVYLAILAAVGLVPERAPLVGQWGGDHVRLTMTAQGGHLTLDCGEGHFPFPTAIDVKGSFTAVGTFELYRPGPTSVSNDKGAPRATYTGHLKGDQMALDVVPSLPWSRKHYELIRNKRTKLVRCM